MTVAYCSDFKDKSRNGKDLAKMENEVKRMIFCGDKRHLTHSKQKLCAVKTRVIYHFYLSYTYLSITLNVSHVCCC